MKRLLTLALPLSLLALVTIAQKAPETWEDKKAARLKDVTEEQQQLIAEAVPSEATAEPASERKILVFWRCEGFIHTSIPHGNVAIAELGEKTGAFSADFSDDYSVFTAENLKQYDLILFNNTTHLAFEGEGEREAIMGFIEEGKGIAGIHAAADNFGKWPEARDMMGGIFNGHPWNAGGKWAFELNDPEHPINAAFDGKGFWHTDEIYQYKPETFQGPENLRILVSLDMTKSKNIQALTKAKKNPVSEEEAKKREVAVSWIRPLPGNGRLFYSNFGHREDTFWNPQILQHFLDGIQYALGDLEADATPTADIDPIAAIPAPPEEA